jgi:hypothetical protein
MERSETAGQPVYISLYRPTVTVTVCLIQTMAATVPALALPWLAGSTQLSYGRGG